MLDFQLSEAKEGFFLECIPLIREQLKQKGFVDIKLQLPSNPNGKPTSVDLKNWYQLAESLECECFVRSHDSHKSQSEIRFVSTLTKENSAPDSSSLPTREKYGEDSSFFKIEKLNNPSFVLDLERAFQYVGITPKDSLLELGSHRADILKLIHSPILLCSGLSAYTGIDYSDSCIEIAKKKFPQPHYRFLCADLNTFPETSIPQSTLLLSIGTLQCTSLDGPNVFKKFFQHALLPHEGKVILGFPNCHYVHGKPYYGARTKNYKAPDLSLLIKDVMYYKKYLQQHNYRVHISGHDYLILSAYKKSSV